MSDWGPNYTPDPDLEERIAEEEREGGLYASSVEWERIMAARERAPRDDNEQRFIKRFYDERPRCEECGGLMVVAAGRRHHTCAPACERCWRPATNCQCSTKAVTA